MGVMCRKRGMTEDTMTVINSFWEFGAFFVNSILFLLIGLTIHVQVLLTHWQPILAAIAAVLLARSLSVFGLIPLLNRLSGARSISWQWQSVLVWGGLRGALSMALALSLPKTFPERPLLIAMVFGVVLFSLLVQGLTISPLLRTLGLSGPPQKV
jgi:CPA1 family monovalent cation:H+ antiporter